MYKAPETKMTKKANGTLSKPKNRHTDSSGKNGKKGLSFGEGENNAKLGKGGKASC